MRIHVGVVYTVGLKKLQPLIRFNSLNRRFRSVQIVVSFYCIIFFLRN
jgi:hypothetical protein